MWVDGPMYPLVLSLCIGVRVWPRSLACCLLSLAHFFQGGVARLATLITVFLCHDLWLASLQSEQTVGEVPPLESLFE